MADPIGPEVDVTVTVNGAEHHLAVPARLSAADLLRDHLGLTGTHLGCEQGVCGACTILVGGRSMRSCLMLAAQLDASEVVTVEGLDRVPEAERLRRTMSEQHGLQCGFCTAGFMVTGTELLCAHAQTAESGTGLDEETVREAISGNLCRCTGYSPIVAALVQASQQTGTPAEDAQAETSQSDDPAAGGDGDPVAP